MWILFFMCLLMVSYILVHVEYLTPPILPLTVNPSADSEAQRKELALIQKQQEFVNLFFGSDAVDYNERRFQVPDNAKLTLIPIDLDTPFSTEIKKRDHPKVLPDSKASELYQLIDTFVKSKDNQVQDYTDLEFPNTFY